MAKKNSKVKIVKPRPRGEPQGVAVADPVRFLADIGVLFHLNNKTLHPLGLGLEVAPDTKEGFRVIDYRNNPVPVFSPEDFGEGQRKMTSYLKTIGEATMSARRALLGFVTQTRAEEGE